MSHNANGIMFNFMSFRRQLKTSKNTKTRSKLKKKTLFRSFLLVVAHSIRNTPTHPGSKLNKHARTQTKRPPPLYPLFGLLVRVPHTTHAAQHRTNNIPHTTYFFGIIHLFFQFVKTCSISTIRRLLRTFISVTNKFENRVGTIRDKEKMPAVKKLMPESLLNFRFRGMSMSYDKIKSTWNYNLNWVNLG